MNWRSSFRKHVSKEILSSCQAPHDSDREAGVSSHETRSLRLIAYRTKSSGPTIVVAPPDRGWMNETTLGFANRCLPLRIANQAGWFILNDRRIVATWNGGKNALDTTIRYDQKHPLRDISQEEPSARSHFGHGILTWAIPYLFRTPVGYNLCVRGPANWCKDGAIPLDAIVETDWAVATFTMNWKIMRPGVSVSFEEGEPICMIFPQPRGDIERFQPEIRDLADEPGLESKYKNWAENRRSFIHSLERPGAKPIWQKHYYVGRSPSGDAFAAHQLKLGLRNFRDEKTER